MFSVFESLEIILVVPFVSVEFPEVFPELSLDIPHKILTRLDFSTDLSQVFTYRKSPFKAMKVGGNVKRLFLSKKIILK